MSEQELKESSSVEEEWDIQWEIFRLLAACEKRDLKLIKGLKFDPPRGGNQ